MKQVLAWAASALLVNGCCHFTDHGEPSEEAPPSCGSSLAPNHEGHDHRDEECEPSEEEATDAGADT